MKKLRIFAAIFAAVAAVSCLGVAVMAADCGEDAPVSGVAVDLVQTVLGDGYAVQSGTDLWAAGGVHVEYTLTAVNNTGRSISGEMSMPLPVMYGCEVVSHDGAEIDGQLFRWNIDGLEDGGVMIQTVVIKLPERLPVYAYGVQAAVRVLHAGHEAEAVTLLNSDSYYSRNLSLYFGEPALTRTMRLTGSGISLDIENAETATGGAANIRVKIVMKRGFDYNGDEGRGFMEKNEGAHIDDGCFIIRAGALVPGGKLHYDLFSNAISRVEVLYDACGHTDLIAAD